MNVGRSVTSEKEPGCSANEKELGCSANEKSLERNLGEMQKKTSNIQTLDTTQKISSTTVTYGHGN